MVGIMRRFLHRFYDLLSGGAEAVILSFVRAFPDDRHLLVFNRYSATAVSEELRSLSNVSGRGIEGQDFARHVADFRPDVLFFHWYPPMSAVDFAGLPRETLNRGILFNHWFSEIPYVAELREYWFPSPTSLAQAGGGIPREKTRVLLNPVRRSSLTCGDERKRGPRSGGTRGPKGSSFPRISSISMKASPCPICRSAS